MDRSLTDQEIIARVAAGDRQCFAELVKRYERALQRVARSRLGRDDWAEEVVQECFLSAFKSCHTYDSRYSFRTWLWTILLNQCRAHYQRRLRSAPAEAISHAGGSAGHDVAAEPSSPVTPLGELLARERRQLLEDLLRQLSPAQADALRLRFFGGLKFQEIATTMGCSLNTAKQRVKWGLLRLADLARAAQLTPRSSDDPAGETP